MLVDTKEAAPSRLGRWGYFGGLIHIIGGAANRQAFQKRY